MNIGVHVSFLIKFCPAISPRVGFLDHMVTLFLMFWGTSILFPTLAIPIYIPTNSVGGSPFSTPSLALVMCRFFLMKIILTDIRWYLIVVLIFISLIIIDVHEFVGNLFVFIGEMFRSSAKFLIDFFLILSCMSFLCILEINPLSVASSANIFSYSEGCAFILFMISFAVQKDLKFN